MRLSINLALILFAIIASLVTRVTAVQAPIIGDPTDQVDDQPAQNDVVDDGVVEADDEAAPEAPRGPGGVGAVVGGDQSFRQTPTFQPTVMEVDYPLYTKTNDCTVRGAGCIIDCTNGEAYDMVDVATFDGGFNQRYYSAIENSSLFTNQM
jgi:hypothetical protein